MKSPIAKEMKEIRDQVRKQDFSWTFEQRERYDTLLLQRYAQIKQWGEEGRIWVGPSNVGKKEEEDTQPIE